MKEPETKDVLAALNQAAKEGKGLEYLDTIATIDDKTLKSFFDTYLAEHQDKTLADIIRDSGLDRTYAYQIIGEFTAYYTNNASYGYGPTHVMVYDTYGNLRANENLTGQPMSAFTALLNSYRY